MRGACEIHKSSIAVECLRPRPREVWRGQDPPRYPESQTRVRVRSVLCCCQTPSFCVARVLSESARCHLMLFMWMPPLTQAKAHNGGVHDVDSWLVRSKTSLQHRAVVHSQLACACVKGEESDDESRMEEQGTTTRSQPGETSDTAFHAAHTTWLHAHDCLV